MEEVPEEKEEKDDIVEADNSSTRETKASEFNLNRASFALKNLPPTPHRYEKSNSATERMSFVSQVSDYQDEDDQIPITRKVITEQISTPLPLH